MEAMKELILGGVRSGKSRFAEARARAAGLPVTYIATATPDDEEMAARIERHREGRPADWSLVEEPRALGAVLSREAGPERCLLVDCLTLWLSNVLAAGDLDSRKPFLLEALEDAPGWILLVSNEVGQGVVPSNRLARHFAEEAGALHQELARRCDRVTLLTAGLPLTLKGDPR